MDNNQGSRDHLDVIGFLENFANCLFQNILWYRLLYLPYDQKETHHLPCPKSVWDRIAPDKNAFYIDRSGTDFVSDKSYMIKVPGKIRLSPNETKNI